MPSRHLSILLFRFIVVTLFLHQNSYAIDSIPKSGTNTITDYLEFTVSGLSITDPFGLKPFPEQSNQINLGLHYKYCYLGLIVENTDHYSTAAKSRERAESDDGSYYRANVFGEESYLYNEKMGTTWKFGLSTYWEALCFLKIISLEPGLHLLWRFWEDTRSLTKPSVIVQPTVRLKIGHPSVAYLTSEFIILSPEMRLGATFYGGKRVFDRIISDKNRIILSRTMIGSGLTSLLISGIYSSLSKKKLYQTAIDDLAYHKAGTYEDRLDSYNQWETDYEEGQKYHSISTALLWAGVIFSSVGISIGF